MVRSILSAYYVFNDTDQHGPAASWGGGQSLQPPQALTTVQCEPAEFRTPGLVAPSLNSAHHACGGGADRMRRGSSALPGLVRIGLSSSLGESRSVTGAAVTRTAASVPVGANVRHSVQDRAGSCLQKLLWEK